MPCTIRPLTPADADAVQQLLERDGGYTDRIRGSAPAPGDGPEVLTALPPGVDPAAKLVLGLFSPADADALVGLVDVVLHWPEPGTAHIGLLLTREDRRGQGLGRLLHDSLRAQLRRLGGIERLRIGIVATNARVASPFWERLGYRPTGEVRPFADGTVTSTAAILSRPLEDPTGLHHLELWTADLDAAEPAWDWLLGTLGWRAEEVPSWEDVQIWRHADGSYVVLEQSADVTGTRTERTRPGMNHVALRLDAPAAVARELLDALRAQAPAHGWSELFAERYPHAGGAEQFAWYGESAEGVEVEVVAAP
ncbi:GNAT family N-acetyltransferase [Brachybacterium sp. DNPG3]